MKFELNITICNKCGLLYDKNILLRASKEKLGSDVKHVTGKCHCGNIIVGKL